MKSNSVLSLEILRSEGEVGEWIRRHRRARKMTQADLASKSGVSATHISRIEGGVNAVRLGTVLALAAAMELDLFGGTRDLAGKFHQPADLTQSKSDKDPSWVHRSIRDVF